LIPIANTIKVENLQKQFRRNVALDNLSFELTGAGPFGIVGPDGAGKTTLMRIFAGIMAFQGKVNVCGFRYPSESEKAKKMLGYMPQAFGLYRDLSVKENLEFYGRIFGMTSSGIKARMPELLEFSRLAPFVNRPAAKLSGGMKQKLALSSCLMHKPDLLILDEPGAGVDPISRREFWQIIQELVTQGIMVVVATTYMDEAEKCARVIYLYDGRIIADDTPEGLRKKYNLKVFSFKCDDLHLFRNLLEESGKFVNVNFFGDELHASGMLNSADVENFVDEIRKAKKCGDINWEEIDPELEDIFVHLSEEKLSGV